ncbi:hypothetical protein PLEOSDRAFT_1112118 [Pleurotus ostreatus PC15]|uniref:Protein YTP1-like C-terminal domain-containing protein n=1 Tax=Pleurotus ostreatus (strain PC15) TaxID=1137138 RepID=A0A067NZU1_PLEO1|nr:hypothetical protein PLEOSDRAFT_1112118 [Pleurotus ostreatus PC15]
MAISPLLLVLSIAAAASAAASQIVARDGHGHHHSNAAPLLVLNETEVTMYHSPTPPSYFTIDWDDPDPQGARHPGLMIAHGLFMMLAFFVALPAGIALRSVKHAWHGVAVLAFYACCALGCASSMLYRKMTPNMYEGAVHDRQGYLILLFAVSLSAIDILNLVRRLVTFFRSSEKFELYSFWHNTILGRDLLPQSTGPEYTGLTAAEPESIDDELAESKLPPSPTNVQSHHPLRRQSDSEDQEGNQHEQTARWANRVHTHRRDYSVYSAASDRTLFATRSPPSEETLQDDEPHHAIPKIKERLYKRVASVAFATAERALVFAGLAQVLTGIVIYTGGCRENYVNGCLAHLIKGAIFWSYGLVTFARFLGSFSELGWAWNRAPSGHPVSAEFVESLVIFIYGITNTWMERFGANPGDPYTTKQIQHIGIAVMFWFAGLVGMGIESRMVRRWLASSTMAGVKVTTRLREEGAIAEPPSYRASFNPFPALVIGVTGAAMAAHFQTYLFQVQIHQLWGNLLLGFSVLRCLTYFFLWLSPPTSVLPSRPPTEALGSFFLACGGLEFMFSTEELTIAAMRRGRDDVMMFLNVGVAITCLAFCWTLCVVAFKGWLKMRSVKPSVEYA